MASLFIRNPHEKQQNVASPKPAARLQGWWVLPSKITFFFLYQTLICVAADEPHPQPQYQTILESASEAEIGFTAPNLCIGKLTFLFVMLLYKKFNGRKQINYN
jgi:hypothetical protein